jgi:CheY-like chemotaxis protein
MQQVTELLDVVVWPAVVVFGVLLFRRALRDVLSRDDLSFSGPAGITVSARRATGALMDAFEAKGSASETGPARRAAIKDAEDQVRQITALVRRLRRSPQVLWVDNRPSKDRYERWALENSGITVDLSTSTDDAQQKLRLGRYDVVVSDMARPEDPRAGYALLSSMQKHRDSTPFVIYSSSNAPEHYDEAIRMGAIGSTARPEELVDMILRVLREARPRARWWRPEK